MANKKKLSLIIPVYNETKILRYFVTHLISVIKKTKQIKNSKYQFEIIIINDGSEDETIDTLNKLADENKKIKYINLSKNFGKEAALTAGIDFCNGDIAIPIDVDFQDDPSIIGKLIEKYEEGYDVVLAKREIRNDNFFKKNFAKLFYILFNLLSDQKIPNNVGDFRLISKKAINTIKLYREKNRFMKGIFAHIGFKTATISFNRGERKIDQPKQSIRKLISLAFNAIINFSTAPLKFIFFLGIILSTSAFGFGIFIILKKMIYNIDTPGFTSIMCVIILLGGNQILSIGIIGLYQSKMYLEIKNRPIYIISETKGF